MSVERNDESGEQPKSNNQGAYTSEGSSDEHRDTLSPVQLAKEDCKIVHNETRLIEGCRSSVFIGTIGALGAIATATGIMTGAVVGAAFEGKNTYDHWRAILLGCTIAIILLTIGILITMEKARALNLRRGFLVAIGALLRKGFPSRYRGWADLRTAHLDCFIKRKATRLAAKKETPLSDSSRYCPVLGRYYATKKNDGVEKEPDTCWVIGNKRAKKLHPKRRIWPGLHDSFMSLSGNVYSAMYLTVGILFLVSLDLVMQHTWLSGAEGWFSISWPYAVGLAVGAFLAALTESFRWIAGTLTKGATRERWAVRVFTVVFKVIVLSVVLLFGFLLLGNTIAWQGSKAIPWLRFFSALVVSFVGWYFLAKLFVTRIGRYSLESYCHGWELVLQNCTRSTLESTENVEAQCEQQRQCR